MSKEKVNLRNVIVIAICLTVTTMFSSCEKKTDYNKLEGTTWKAETDTVVFILRFIDETSCTLMIGRTDGTYSANSTTYFWRYRSDVDSQWGLFFLSELKENGETVSETYSGTIDNKELYLRGSTPENYGFEMKFKRIKN